MDPNAALANIRRLAGQLIDASPRTADEKREMRRRAVELAEACEALDGWIAGGGFLPAAWDRKR